MSGPLKSKTGVYKMTSKRNTIGKAVINIHPVSYEDYEKLMKKIERWSHLYYYKYHSKFIPNGGKE